MAITEPQLYRCSILETVCAPKVHIPTVLGSRIVLSLVAQCHATQKIARVIVVTIAITGVGILGIIEK